MSTLESTKRKASNSLASNLMGNQTNNRNNKRCDESEINLAPPTPIDAAFVMNLINKECENCCCHGNCLKNAYTSEDGDMDWNGCMKEVTRCREISNSKTSEEKRKFAVTKLKDSIVGEIGPTLTVRRHQYAKKRFKYCMEFQSIC